MKKKEIIELGTKLGLKFDEKSNYYDQLEKNIVVFDGENSQRFLIDGSWTDEEIYAKMGRALKAMGSMKLRLELNSMLSITNTNY
jgi:hypothetical protein